MAPKEVSGPQTLALAVRSPSPLLSPPSPSLPPPPSPVRYYAPGFDGFVTYVLTPYFGFLPGSPSSLPAWAALHDYAEFFGGALLAVGLLARPASLALFGSMLAAIYFHLASTGLQGFPLGHVDNYSYNFEEPVLYACIFLLFAVVGAGPLSVDEKIYEKLVEGLDEE